MPSSPHEFFKVFLLSSDYRPSVDRPSTECWPITDRYIGQVSTNYRRSVGERKAISAETHLERLSTVSRPSVVRLSSKSRPTIDRLSTAISTECRPTINQVSTECVSTHYRTLYRPIDRSTLPTVNMIRLKQRQIKNWGPFRINLLMFNVHVQLYM